MMSHGITPNKNKYSKEKRSGIVEANEENAPRQLAFGDQALIEGGLQTRSLSTQIMKNQTIEEAIKELFEDNRNLKQSDINASRLQKDKEKENDDEKKEETVSEEKRERRKSQYYTNVNGFYSIKEATIINMEELKNISEVLHILNKTNSPSTTSQTSHESLFLQQKRLRSKETSQISTTIPKGGLKNLQTKIVQRKGKCTLQSIRPSLELPSSNILPTKKRFELYKSLKNQSSRKRDQCLHVNDCFSKEELLKMELNKFELCQQVQIQLHQLFQFSFRQQIERELSLCYSQPLFYSYSPCNSIESAQLSNLSPQYFFNRQLNFNPLLNSFNY